MKNTEQLTPRNTENLYSRYDYLEIVDFNNPRYQYLDYVSVRPLLWGDVAEKRTDALEDRTAKTLKWRIIEILFYIRFELFR